MNTAKLKFLQSGLDLVKIEKEILLFEYKTCFIVALSLRLANAIKSQQKQCHRQQGDFLPDIQNLNQHTLKIIFLSLKNSHNLIWSLIFKISHTLMNDIFLSVWSVCIFKYYIYILSMAPNHLFIYFKNLYVIHNFFFLYFVPIKISFTTTIRK